MNLGTLKAIGGQVDERTFVERFPHPMLLLKKSVAGAAGPSDLDWRVRTQRGAAIAGDAAKAARSSAVLFHLQVSSVEPVAKTTKNPFVAMITIGRAPNNDVCLPSSSVSKLHAYFQQDGARWLLRDGTSANGTFVNGKRLASGEAEALADGAHLAFGPDMECLFKLPVPLFQLLAQLPSLSR